MLALKQLRKRKLVQWALAYAAGAWVLLQVVGLMVESYDWPHLVMRVGFATAALGFVITCVLAWYHGERGAQRVSGPELVILTLLLAAGGGLLWRIQSQASSTAVQAANSPAPAPARASAVPVAAIPARSIAVLPFDNLSGKPEDAYLADGLQEEILNALARIRDLKVISRTSVEEFRGKALNIRDIGKRLGVRTVLEGSVRREGDKLRLTIQLIDAGNDNHLLATNYDRKLTEVLDLQTKVARQVADALSATLTGYERGQLDRITTNSGDAYDKYLRAVVLEGIGPNGHQELVESRRLLEQALVYDPDFTDALALLSRKATWLSLNQIDGRADALVARKSFERALAIDPNSPEAKMARGLYETYVTQDLDQAVADLGEVALARPNDAMALKTYGWALRRRGNFAEALKYLRRASLLDPLSASTATMVIATTIGLHRYQDAIEPTKKLVSLAPDAPDAHFWLARLQGTVQHSLQPLRDALRDHGNLLDPDGHKAIEAEIAQGEGRYLDAAHLWEALPPKEDAMRAVLLGQLYAAAGDSSHAHDIWLAAEKASLSSKQAHLRAANEFNELSLALVQSLLSEHAAALARIDALCAKFPESKDAVNGPTYSFARSIILLRAGRRVEGIAEANRLLRLPHGAPNNIYTAPDMRYWTLLAEAKQAPFDELINHPPRL